MITMHASMKTDSAVMLQATVKNQKFALKTNLDKAIAILHIAKTCRWAREKDLTLEWNP